VTIALRDRGVTAILLDIEGTTTPFAFVHATLFPFARARLRPFLHDQWETPDVRAIVGRLAQEHAVDAAAGAGPPAWSATADGVAPYAAWLMDRDRKSPGLKDLQGRIWERGYHAGLLTSDVFADTPGAIRRWREAGLDVAIYSSGSALAQRLLFANTPGGDLTPLLNGFFDTAVGPKQSPDSYARIAARLGRVPGEILFISDVSAELRAANAAGLQVVLSVRPGNPPQDGAQAFEAIASFDEIALLP
jgi:enolase-phosphatase E1